MLVVRRALSTMSTFKGFGTIAVHAGQDPDSIHGCVVPGISTSTTFAQTAPGHPIGEHEYARSSNPTRKNFETALAAVENGKFGFAFSSGLSALTTICHLLAKGDHIVSMEDVYGGTHRYLTQIAVHFGLEVDFVDCSKIDVLKAAIKPNTKMMWLESPTNPTLRLLDIAACAEVAKEKNIISVVDNTFMSAYFQRPLDLGATIVMHSLTKYMNGHSDVVAGACVTNDEKIAAKLKFLQNGIGTVSGPFDSYLANRGLKTLHVRMRQHALNAMAVARFLEAHPKLFTLAESLGAVESLAELPSLMTHAGLKPEFRAHLGITDNLVRLSVGIEEEEDIIADLSQALDKAVRD